MNKIQECVEKLLEVIREDSAYQRSLACEDMLKSNPELNAYLEAELDVCRMLQQVQEQFRNGIDLNISNV